MYSADFLANIPAPTSQVQMGKFSINYCHVQIWSDRKHVRETSSFLRTIKRKLSLCVIHEVWFLSLMSWIIFWSYLLVYTLYTSLLVEPVYVCFIINYFSLYTWMNTSRCVHAFFCVLTEILIVLLSKKCQAFCINLMASWPPLTHFLLHLMWLFIVQIKK